MRKTTMKPPMNTGMPAPTIQEGRNPRNWPPSESDDKRIGGGGGLGSQEPVKEVEEVKEEKE